ncbi:hypothetical protein FF38_08118 [Lucilia cuprina]|uniref:Uncharacterized protein n=1 Tax=Lucilia cuprina TaxID=7375 RepID=A0A0L0CKW9_LUCCU|nr:hypothetical protein FF38_08118 [Lucilia cuprina]
MNNWKNVKLECMICFIKRLKDGPSSHGKNPNQSYDTSDHNSLKSQDLELSPRFGGKFCKFYIDVFGAKTVILCFLRVVGYQIKSSKWCFRDIKLIWKVLLWRLKLLKLVFIIIFNQPVMPALIRTLTLNVTAADDDDEHDVYMNDVFVFLLKEDKVVTINCLDS